MSGLLALLKKELLSLWVTPVAWGLLVVFLLIQGLSFSLMVAHFVNLSQLSFDYGPVQAYFGGSTFLVSSLLLICPVLTMGTFAEERRSGTIEALIYSCAQPGDPLLLNTTWMQETLSGWEQSKALGMLGGGFPPTPDGLVGYLDTRGLTVIPQCKDFMGTESHNFTIRAIAQVGEVTRTMTTVMRVHRTTEELYYYAVR